MPNRRNYVFNTNAPHENWNYVRGTVVSSSQTKLLSSRSATDYVRIKPKGRWIAPTNYSMLVERKDHPSGTWDRTSVSTNQLTGWERGVILVCGSQWLTDCSTLCGSFPSELANRALIKARLKLKSSDVNLAVAFGERQQTARLVGDSLTRIAKGFRALRRGNLKELRKYLNAYSLTERTIRNVPQAWLEIQYGWKPLLSDIHGAVSALDNRDRSDYMVTVKGSAVKEDKNVYFENNSNSSSHWVVEGSVKHGTFVRIDACPSNNALKTASSLGLTNPASLAWELLPFSFVVDWAYPLGDYFDQMDAIAGWEVKGFSSSNFTKCRLRVRGTSHTQSGNYYRADWKARWEKTQLGRTSGTTVPFPMLPSIKDPFSQTHVANALSLLAGAFGHIGRRIVR